MQHCHSLLRRMSDKVPHFSQRNHELRSYMHIMFVFELYFVLVGLLDFYMVVIVVGFVFNVDLD